MIEPILSLAFSVHSNPGVYAVLLGSGVSRAASIPTGWEVVLELVRKVATLEGADCGSDPAAWYASTFGEAPDYGKMLRQVAKLPAERQSLLRSYFEANADERAAGLKQPTRAHKAIASLVQSGHIRVIVTTNFDRLMEQSLEAVGVPPTVISTADGAEGATPLTHARCTVIKLHGDYLDARIKNTPDELAKYDKRMNKLLDRVFDEFGLIVSGWSSDWDEALRTAMQRCKNRRFTTYWATRGKLSESAEKIVQLRGAQVITGLDADAFFAGLQQKVEALAAFNRPHPLSVATAVATMKRFLSSPQHKIELHDLVHTEVEAVVAATSDERMLCTGTVPWNEDEVRKRIGEYEASVEILCSIVAIGCYWGTDEHRPLWVRALERLATRADIGGVTAFINLRHYPALLVLYTAGMAAIASGNYGTLQALFNVARVREREKDRPLVDVLDAAYSIMDQQTGQAVFKKQRHYTPLNTHLFEILREPLRTFLPNDQDYEAVFDRFEYLLAIVRVDLDLEHGTSEDLLGVPVGRFGWRKSFSDNESHIAKALREERYAKGNDWPLVRQGLVVSLERFDRADLAIKKRVALLPWH